MPAGCRAGLIAAGVVTILSSLVAWPSVASATVTVDYMHGGTRFAGGLNVAGDGGPNRLTIGYSRSRQRFLIRASDGIALDPAQMPHGRCRKIAATKASCPSRQGGPLVALRGGNDVLRGRANLPTGLQTDGLFVIGGAGRDLLSSGPGPDYIDGGAGSDIIRGGPGGDDLDGKGGHDSVYGGRGDDSLGSGAAQGRDKVIDCGPGDDFLYMRRSALHPPTPKGCEHIKSP